ncbi:hypothetical protein HKD37_08G023779 [Glycine soja]
MAHSTSLIFMGRSFSPLPKTKVSVSGRLVSRSSAGLRIQAVQENGGPRRLVDIIRLGGSVFEGDSPMGLASWTRGGAWWTRQWSWRVAVHVAGPATLRVAGPATWTATRQLHWQVHQAPPRVQLANLTGESP